MYFDILSLMRTLLCPNQFYWPVVKDESQDVAMHNTRKLIID